MDQGSARYPVVVEEEVGMGSRIDRRSGWLRSYRRGRYLSPQLKAVSSSMRMPTEW